MVMTRNMERQKYTGAVALTATLVIMAVLTAMGIALVLTSINLRNSTQSYYNSKILNVTADNCLEESVDRLKVDTSYMGSLNLISDKGSCVASISDSVEPNVKVIHIEAEFGEFSTFRQYHLDVSEHPYKLL